MTASLIEVETADLVAAAHALQAEVGDPMCDVTIGLAGALSGSGGMAGNDPGGRDWANEYDRAARATLRASEDVINGCYKLASMFVHTAQNYVAADAASTAGVRHAVARTLRDVPSDTIVSFGLELPGAAGGAGGAPDGWGLISHVVGWVWPNGHQDRLHAAGRAWHSSASSFWNAAEFAAVAAGRAAADGLPEAADMQTVCAAMYDHLVAVAHAHRALGDACHELARHIDHMHAEVVGELESLLEWTAGIEIGGALLSVVTLGGSEAAAQAAEGARIARTAARVASIIERFSALARTAARALTAVTDRIEPVGARVRAVLDVRITTAAVVGVGRIPIVRMSGEVGAAGRLADARISKAFRDIDNPKLFDPHGLKGLTMDEVKAAIPRGWTPRPSTRGGGEVWEDPAHRGRQIRIMPGYGRGARPGEINEGPYVVITQNGSKVKVPLAGNPVSR